MVDGKSIARKGEFELDYQNASLEKEVAMKERFAFLSDAHGDHGSLCATLEQIAHFKPDRVFFLGDIEDHYSRSLKSLNEIMSANIESVIGNHDIEICFEPPDSNLTCFRTKENVKEHWLTLKQKNYLIGLPHRIETESYGLRFMICHATPSRINEYLYRDSPLQNFVSIINRFPADVYISAHTHIPFTKEVMGKLFVNVGSVSLPRDGNPHPCFSIADISKGRARTVGRVKINQMRKSLSKTKIPV